MFYSELPIPNCRISLVAGKKDNNALLLQTHWHLSVMKACIQLKALFVIPYDFNTESNFECDTVWNALEMSV